MGWGARKVYLLGLPHRRRYEAAEKQRCVVCILLVRGVCVGVRGCAFPTVWYHKINQMFGMLCFFLSIFPDYVHPCLCIPY